MRARFMTALVTMMVLSALGCRTAKPNLKPPMTAEALNSPPAENRFDTPTYPKEAFNNRDPIRKINTDEEIMPVTGRGLQGMGGR